MGRAARETPALNRRGCWVSVVRGSVPPGLSLPGVPRGRGGGRAVQGLRKPAASGIRRGAAL